MKRKIHDMPVEEVYLHPQFVALPPAGRGMLFTLLLHFWFSDCAPIPTSPGDLYGVCRPNARVWGTHKDMMLSIFNDVAPGLIANMAYKKMRRQVAHELGNRGRGIYRLRTLAKKQAAHGAREDLVPQREANPTERVARPEERGARAKVTPTKGG